MSQKGIFTVALRAATSFTKFQHQKQIYRCLSTQQTQPDPTATSPSPSALDNQQHIELLARPLTHRLPPQYLQHSTSIFLSEEEKAQREEAGLRPHGVIRGVVVDAGKMDKTVKVRILGMRWEKRIGKYFRASTNYLVHDPASSLIIGDVVALHRLRVSSAVHHVVASIVAPFGKPISERPAIPTPDERLAAYKAKRFAKLERRELRKRAAGEDEGAVGKLRERGLEAEGQGTDGGKEKGMLGKGGKVDKSERRAKKENERDTSLEKKKEGNVRKARGMRERVAASTDLETGMIIGTGRNH